MIHKVLDIEIEQYHEHAKLYTYFLDNSEEIDAQRVRPVVVLCPGGGYEMTSDREAEGIAMQFLAAGCHVVILRYSVYPALYPTALLQLAKTVIFLRENAQKFHIDKEKIIIQGCSAGGHLAASYGVFWRKKEFISKSMKVTPQILRPNGLLLCYPVITSGEKTHEGSMIHLLGEQIDTLREEMSLEKQVSQDTPPTFLWHTDTDDTVPVENSILFYQALHKEGISVEMHIYPVGGHGLSLANKETCHNSGYGIQKECQSWIKLAVRWIHSFF